MADTAKQNNWTNPKTRPKPPAALVRVSGEAFTYRQIAERVGRAEISVKQRVARLRRAGKPVTWEALTLAETTAKAPV